ncbi:MAG: hypothetical protein AAGI66_08310 [Cyanobacteria bacterium P01_H01_bin.74]
MRTLFRNYPQPLRASSRFGLSGKPLGKALSKNSQGISKLIACHKSPDKAPSEQAESYFTELLAMITQPATVILFAFAGVGLLIDSLFKSGNKNPHSKPVQQQPLYPTTGLSSTANPYPLPPSPAFTLQPYATQLPQGPLNSNYQPLSPSFPLRPSDTGPSSTGGNRYV